MKIIKTYILIFVVIAAVVVAGWFVLTKTNFIGASFEKNTRIENTAEEIKSIKQIKQWEFLSVTTEEMVDTTRKKLFFSDDQLCNIYSGNLRIGVNLEKAAPDWVTVNDTVANVKLPAVGLLDDRFIDEASTRVFYESGKWNGAAMDALYKKAQEKMKRRALTKKNLDKAKANGVQTFTRLFESLGYKKVNVTFEN